MDTPPAPATLVRRVLRRVRQEAGQGMVEYAFILVLVAMAVLIGLQVLGRTTNGVYSNIANGLST